MWRSRWTPRHLFLFFVCLILLLGLCAWGSEALREKPKRVTQADTYRAFLERKRQQAPPPPTRNPAALFILDSSNTDHTRLGLDDLALISNSISGDEELSEEMRTSLVGGIWLQDFNWTYSNQLDVVDSYEAAALISLLVASGTKHCTSGLCLRDVSEAWQRSAIERGLLERTATSSFDEKPSTPGGLIPQMIGHLGWGQFKVKKRPDNTSATLFKAATEVSQTAFSDLVKRNGPALTGMMQKKNLQGIIDFSQALDVTPFLERLQKYTLVLKLGLNNYAVTEKLTIVFTNAFIQSFRLVMPDATMHGDWNVLEELGWRFEGMKIFYEPGFQNTIQSFSGRNSYFKDS